MNIFTVDGILGLFKCLVLKNNAAVNICGHIFRCTYVRISVRHIPRGVVSVT